jgi:hypothetical protein
LFLNSFEQEGIPYYGKVNADVSLKVKGPIIAPKINAELKLKAKRIGVISSGSSTITLDGSAESLDIPASGPSNLRALELILDTAEIRPSGSSNIRIVVNSLIDSRCLG